MNFEKKLLPIKGDASFRKFYRQKIKKKSSIIVFSEKEKIKNLLNYDSINKLLVKKNINAPRLLSENYNKNLIEIDDLGTKTVFDILKKKNSNKLKIYKKILPILIKMQKIKIKKIKNFKKKFYKIQTYSNKLIFSEASLFLDWYVPKVINKNNKIRIKKELKKIITSLIKKIKLSNNTFVHRDFHVSNLMYHNKKIALIDSQDALIGNKAYDLASLIDDVRLKTSNELKEKVFKFYIKTNKKIDLEKFKKDFEILSVLRNLKIIGIFMRLAVRDNKKKYLKLIPYAWELINHRIKEQNEFNNLMLLLKNNFPKFIR